MAAPKQSKLATLKADLDRVTSETKGEAADLAKRHGTLLKEREAVRTALQPAEVCVQNARRLVDEAREKWIKTHGREVTAQVSGGPEIAEGTYVEVVRGPRLPFWGRLDDGALTFEDLCGLFPALAVDALARVVEESNSPHGLSPAERAKRIAEIDAELRQVEEQHADLRESAAAAGLEIAPLGYRPDQTPQEQGSLLVYKTSTTR